MAVPTVATTAVSEVTDSTAESGGTITSDGGASLTHYGVCWSAHTPPTIGDYFTVDWMADITGTGALSIGAVSLSGAGATPDAITGTGTLTSAKVACSGVGAVATEDTWVAGADTHPDLFTVVANPTIVSGSVGSPTVYEWKRFVRSSSTSSVVQMNSENSSQQKHDIEFRNCIFDCDYLTYQNTHGPCTINDRDGWTHRIRFYNCWFKGYFDGSGVSQHGMSFECTGRGQYPSGTYTRGMTYDGIELYDCVFDAGGYEGCSFDDNYNKTYNQDQGIIVQDCIIRGGGNRSGTTWGQGFEFNGNRGCTVKRLKIYRTRGSMLNLTGPGSEQDSNWYFEDCEFDYTDEHAQQVIATSSDSRTMSATNMSYAEFVRCTFNAGSVAGESSFNNGYITTCNYNTFTGCSWLGDGTKYRVTYNGTSTGNNGFPN